MPVTNKKNLVDLSFNEYVTKCIEASNLSLDVQVDLHLNGVIRDKEGVKHRLSVSMLEHEAETEDLAVVQDIDAFIASDLNNVPLVETGRFRVHAYNLSEHVIRRLDYGSTLIDDETVMLKNVPHTILFTADNGALLKCHIIFPKMYNAESRRNHIFSNKDQEFFYDKIFIKAANNVCDPSVLSRVNKSYRHALAKGIQTLADSFMYGQDLINIVDEMRKIISLDSHLFRFGGFFLTLSAFGFKQRVSDNLSVILPSMVDWSKLDKENVYIDIATNLYNKAKPSLIFALKSKAVKIAKAYGVSEEDKPSYYPHILSDFGGFSVKPKTFTGALKPKRLICYSAVKNPFTGIKKLNYKTGCFGPHWVPQDLWGDNDRSIRAVNVSKIE